MSSVTAERAALSARGLLLFAAFTSFALSVTIWFTGHQMTGIFVGLWVPSILSLANFLLPRAERR